VSWYTVMACAFDVWRTRDSGKRAVLKRLLCRAHPELPDTPVGQLLSAFMLWTCRGWTPWVIGWLSPPILMSVLVLVWPRLLSWSWGPRTQIPSPAGRACHIGIELVAHRSESCRPTIDEEQVPRRQPHG